MLGSLSFRVTKLLRLPTRFVGSELPVSRISQKVGHVYAAYFLY